MLILSFLIGVIAGLRAMTAAAAMSWAAAAGSVDLTGSPLSVLDHRFAPWILSLLALAEFVSDKLPKTPSRKVPVQFGTRILVGAVAGAAIGIGGGMAAIGAVTGAAGAVVGTLGGAAARAKLATALGKDSPAALIEDCVAIVGAVLIALVL